MTTQANFTLRGRNPDVLTCIANLSNDEVFTPPEFANRMLDTLAEAWAANHGGADLWADKVVKFLDPCTKSGVFLREITSRLTKGLEKEIPNLEKRVHHILAKQVFGIGITQITSLLARRSVYCSKHAKGEHSINKSFASDDGNIWFKRLKHTWDGDRCKYCGAGKSVFDRAAGLETHAYAFIHTDNIKTRLAEIFGGNMQFDVIIGNPPYQMSTGGGTATQQASPIYQEFVRQACALEPRFVVMVIPSRWFSGGMPVLDTFRKDMLGDHRIRALVDFPDSRDAFTGVDVAGGVNYFLWDSVYNGQCNVTTVSGTQEETVMRELDAYSVFVRSNGAISIVERVRRSEGFKPLTSLVSAVSPFGLPTSFRGAESSHRINSPIVVRSTAGRQWAQRDVVQKNAKWVDMWKVLLSATSSEHAGQADRSGMRRIFSRIEILEPGTATTHSYLIVGPTISKSEAVNVAHYLRTKFVRFLVSLVLATQHVSKSNFAFVPVQDFSKLWTDSELYKKYKLTKNEIAFIESIIRPMDPSETTDDE